MREVQNRCVFGASQTSRQLGRADQCFACPRIAHGAVDVQLPLYVTRRLQSDFLSAHSVRASEPRSPPRPCAAAPLDPSLLLDLPAFGEDIDAAAQEEPAPIADAPRGWHATHHDLGHGVTGTRWRRPRSQVHPDLANTCSDYRASAFVPPAPVESAETIRYDSAAAAATASLFPPQAEVWALSGYPGYVLLRGALSPATQLALCCDVLLQLCDAPAATNHARSMGLLPPGLFRAAREGRVLAPGQTCCAWGGCPGCGGCQDGLGGHVGDGRGAGSESGTDGDPLQLSRETGTSPWHWCEPGCPSLAAMGSRDTEAGVTEGDREPPSSPSPDPAPSSSPASSSLPPGSGTQASSLLSRLRWSTLGPTYDWGRRVYLKDSPCMPLPPFLARLAAEAVGLCGVLAGGDGVGGGCGVDRDEEGRACEGFRPDAAIVNYYRQVMTMTSLFHQYISCFFNTSHVPICLEPSHSPLISAARKPASPDASPPSPPAARYADGPPGRRRA